MDFGLFHFCSSNIKYDGDITNTYIPHFFQQIKFTIYEIISDCFITARSTGLYPM